MSSSFGNQLKEMEKDVENKGKKGKELLHKLAVPAANL